jgi:hypothetical protein
LRIRGALGIGITWATAWVLAGLLMFSLIGLVATGEVRGAPVLRAALEFGLSGLAGGTSFSVLLGLAEGRRSFHEMSLPRFAGWGALAAAVIYGGAVTLFGSGWGAFPLAMAAVTASLGAGCAAGSLALARKADDGGLLRPGVEDSETGLPTSATDELLGHGE